MAAADCSGKAFFTEWWEAGNSRKKAELPFARSPLGRGWAVLDANQRDIKVSFKHTMKQILLPLCTGPTLVNRTAPRHCRLHSAL